MALGAQSAAAATSICVAANGEVRAKKGSADCKAEGTGSTALAKGDQSYAQATGGTRNRAMVRADGGTAYAGDIDPFNLFGGSFNTATVTGDGGQAYAGFGDNNTATANTDGCTVQVTGVSGVTDSC